NPVGPPTSPDVIYSKEEQDFRNKLRARQNQLATSGRSRAVLFGVDATAPAKLDDYQLQLLMLEQQNKKRLLAARQEQWNASFGAPSSQQQRQHQPAPLNATARPFGSSNEAHASAGGGLFGAARPAMKANNERSAAAQQQQQQQQQLQQQQQM